MPRDIENVNPEQMRALLEAIGVPPPPPEPRPILPQQIQGVAPMPRGKDIGPELLKKFEEEVVNRRRLGAFPGTGHAEQLEELNLKRRKGIPGPGESLRSVLNEDELRLILADNNFAKELLAKWGRKNTPADILKLRKAIYHEHPEVISNTVGMQGKPLPSFEEESRNFGKLNEYFPKSAQRAIQERGEARVNKHEELNRQYESLLQQGSTHAPLQPGHERAQHILTNPRPSESLRLAEREIAAAGRTDIPRAIEPYLRQASESPRAFVEQYKTDYQPLIDTYRQEASKDFMEHILPSINNRFAQQGTFYSGARMASIAKAKADKEQRIENEVKRLLVHAQEEGMKHYHQHRTGTLSQAEIAGKAHGMQKDSKLREAEALRIHGMTEQTHMHQNATMQSQLGAIEQQDLQNKLNVAQHQYEKQQEEPLRDVERAASIAAGQPIQQHALSQALPNIRPPNPLGFAAGILGQGLGLMGQQNQGQQGYSGFARGGLVRRGYAGGDSVSRAVAQLNQLKSQAVQESPEEAEMRSSAQAFKNHQANPMADYLFTTGSHMLANMGEDPIKTFGQGSQLGFQAMKSAQGENLSAKEKYNKLMGKIAQSKMYQHELASKYHINQQQHEEQERYHNATLGETRRAHDMMYGQRNGESSGNNPKLPTFSSKEEQKAFWKEQGDAKKELQSHRKLVTKDINNLRHFKKLIEGGIGHTGPGMDIVPNAVATWLYAPEVASNRFLAQKALNEKVLDFAGMMKGAQSDKDMAILQGTVPTMSDTPKTFKKYLDKWEKLAKRDEEGIKFLDKKIKSGVPITLAQEEWHDYVNENPLFAEEEEVAQKSPTNRPEIAQKSGGGDMVPVIGPDGEEWMIPHANVEAALQAGGQLAQ